FRPSRCCRGLRLATRLPSTPIFRARLVGRMSEDFESWRTRDLASEEIVYLFLDGWYPKVRIGKWRERVPVLVTLGVRSDGGKVVDRKSTRLNFSHVKTSYAVRCLQT